MANQLKVDRIHAIHVLWQQGWPGRRIARELGIHRETVTRYVKRFQAQAVGATPAISTPGTAPPLDAKPAISTPGPVGRRSLCAEHEPWIGEQLALGLSAQRIHQDLVAERGFTGSYQSVKRFVRAQQRTTPLPFRRLECAPGEEAQVDFGRGAPIVPLDGPRRRPHLFRIVLSHSRKAYSEVVPRQTTEAFIRCLENAFWAFGGVPKTLVIDNLKAAVPKADWYDPELHPKIQQFARHYGTVFLPTRPYTPRHKGKVEGGVKYAQNNALHGRVFASLAEQNQFLATWERTVADHRIHGTTRTQVAALFRAQEQAALLPVPAQRFPCFQEGQRTVHRDGHVAVEQAFYSVPPEYLGAPVWVRWDQQLLRVFNQRWEAIAVHVRVHPGRFSTLPAHIHPAKIAGIERGAAYWLAKARRIGPCCGRWAAAMLAARGIYGIRVLQGFVALAGKQPAAEMERVTAVAVRHGAFRLRALRQLLAQPGQQEPLPFIEHHPLIRDLAEYGQLIRTGAPARKEVL